MADLNDKLNQVRDKIQKAPHILSGEQKKREVADILNGLTKAEIEELRKKTWDLEDASVTPIEQSNMMEVALLMSRHVWVDTWTTTPSNGPINIDTIPIIDNTPIDTNNPGNREPTVKPDFESNDFKGKKVNIQTRGQEIKTDSFDYQKEYPGKGELQSPMDAARDILRNSKWLNASDKAAIQAIRAEWWNDEAICRYLEGQIIKQRNQATNNAERRQFNTIVRQCLDKIPNFLGDILGKDVQEKLSELPDPKRIHFVGEYDFLSIAGHRGACGIFRTEQWDIYVSERYIAQFEWRPDIGVIQTQTETIRFPRIFREIKGTLIHELLHGMSVINYVESKGKIWTRRIWLVHANFNKRDYGGHGGNEGTTEHLTHDILERWYKGEWLLNYQAPRTSYEDEQKIVQALVDSQDINIKWLDFYKGMLLRKHEAGKEIERVTPLWELVKKMNGGDTLLNSPRPYFYQIIMRLADYVNEKNVSNVDFIIDFIKNKDISILKKNLGVNINTVFNKLLLNPSRTDFNDLILKAYSKTA